jgi:class 3 adenylate cyclase/predicted ATPase
LVKSVFLFTDIEGSTGLWDHDREGMSSLLSSHDALTIRLVEEHGGTVVKHTGDGFFIHFTRPDEAVACAVRLMKELWNIPASPSRGRLRVRMGIHAGQAEARGGDYFGPAVNQAQRVMDSGAGGQILATADLVQSLDRQVPSVSFKDLGVHRLRDLSEPRRLFLVEEPGLPPVERPSPRTLGSIPNNLRRPLTRFVGREAELIQITGLLKKKTIRLLTLHGHGGTGKTRLALQAGAMEAFSFPQGVFVVEMEHAVTEESLLARIGRAAGMNPEGEAIDLAALERHFRGGTVLLILDGCEGLAGSAEALPSLLERLPDLKILVTSRVRLGLSCENIFLVQGMRTSSDSGTPEAVTLFLETAERTSSHAIPSGPCGEKAERICSILEGNPLAIVLAASWSGVLAPDEILEQLCDPLSISSNLNDLPERHRSLRAVFQFSWNSLDAGEKRSLAALSVFSGGFTIADASVVCGLEPGGLAALMGKSLVEKLEGGPFRLHPLVRDFAVEKAGEVLSEHEISRLMLKHADRFLGALDSHANELRQGDQAEAFRELAPMAGEIVSAWRRAVAGAWPAAGRKTSGALRSFLGLLGMYSEGERLFQESIRCFEGDDLAMKAAMHCALGWFRSYCSTRDESIAELKTAVELYKEAGCAEGLGEALNTLGNTCYIAGLYSDAADAYEESLRIRRELDDTSGVSAVLNNLGNLAFEAEDYDAAKGYYLESLAIEKTTGNSHGVSSTLTNLAITAIEQDRLEEAHEMLLKALEIEKSIGDDFNQAIVQGVFCTLHLKTGDHETAFALSGENLKTYTRLGNGWGQADTHRFLGELHMKRGFLQESAKSFARAAEQTMERGWTPLSLEILAGAAMLLREMGHANRASELAGFVTGQGSCPARTTRRLRTLKPDPPGTLDMEQALAGCLDFLKTALSQSSTCKGGGLEAAPGKGP